MTSKEHLQQIIEAAEVTEEKEIVNKAYALCELVCGRVVVAGKDKETLLDMGYNTIEAMNENNCTTAYNICVEKGLIK